MSDIIEIVTKVTFWAIGDLHLSFAKPRDFSRFSDKWDNHTERIEQSWRRHVQPNDIVLLLGDTSWANSLKQAKADLKWLAALPGEKILIRGNHDRWWFDINKVRNKALPEHFYAIQDDSLTRHNIIICGAQGHYAPNDPLYKPDPPKNRFEREMASLENSLQHAAQHRQDGQELIILTHFPPFTTDGQETAFSALVERYAPATCLYGHLHRPEEWAVAVQTERHGVRYRLLAADYLDMMLQEILVVETDDET